MRLENTAELTDFDTVGERAAACRAAAMVGVSPSVLEALRWITDDGRRSARDWLMVALDLDTGRRRAA